MTGSALPRGTRLGDDRLKVQRLGDPGRPRDRLAAEDDHHLLARLDLGEQAGQMRLASPISTVIATI